MSSTEIADTTTTRETVISPWEQAAIIAAADPVGEFYVPAEDLSPDTNRQQFTLYMETLARFFAKQATLENWKARAAAENLSTQETAAAAAVSVLVGHLADALGEIRRMITTHAPAPEVPAADYVLRETLSNGVWQTRSRGFAAGLVRPAFRDPSRRGADAYGVSDCRASDGTTRLIGRVATISDAQELIRRTLLAEIRGESPESTK